MVFFLENVEKFFDDHPELRDHRAAVIARAEKIVESGGTIPAGQIATIFSDLAPLFKEEMMSFEHIAIGVEKVKALQQH